MLNKYWNCSVCGARNNAKLTNKECIFCINRWKCLKCNLFNNNNRNCCLLCKYVKQSGKKIVTIKQLNNFRNNIHRIIAMPLKTRTEYITFGYLRNLEYKLKLKYIIPNDIYIMILQFYQILDQTEIDNKYWDKFELFDRYLPLKQLHCVHKCIVFEGKAICNHKSMKINTKVAIKKIYLTKTTDTLYMYIKKLRLLRELKILRMLEKNDFIVNLYDILPPKDPINFDSLTLVFECFAADLSTILRTDQYFSSLHVEYMLYQILLGVNCMHSIGIIHRDLKPKNILINADCSLKICDLGSARGFNVDTDINELMMGSNNSAFSNLNGIFTTHITTRWYRAPEVILLRQTKEHMKAMDIWSVGCIFAELLEMEKVNCPNPITTNILGISIDCKRRPLFRGDSCYPMSPRRYGFISDNDQIRVIFKVIGTPTKKEINEIDGISARDYLNNIPHYPAKSFRDDAFYPGISDDALDLLNNLLKFDVKKRLSAKDAVNHSYFKTVINNDFDPLIPQKYEFEDKKLNMDEINQAIFKEILYYHSK